MNHYLLIYDTAPDYLERRGGFRAEHLALGWAAHTRGEMLLGGALPAEEGVAGGAPGGAVFVFQGDSPVAAEAFAQADPYVRNGLILRWRVRPWTTVIGEGAATPVRPSA
ncbi:MAG: YciI-like protein [Gammaproteobacteria bacterium]